METPVSVVIGSYSSTFKTSLEEWKRYNRGFVRVSIHAFKTSLEEWKRGWIAGHTFAIVGF